MASPASIAKHPIHPMLIPLPIGLWILSFICDLIYVIGWGGTGWKDVAIYTMAGGIIGALLAAVPGLIDLFSLAGKRLRIGVTHMIINLVIVGIYTVSLWLRTKGTPDVTLPVVLSAIGIILLLIPGWLGGELVYVHGVAVEPQHEQKGRTNKIAGSKE